MIQVHRFASNGAEGIVEALEAGGTKVGLGAFDSAVQRHIIVFRDPFEAHLRLLFSTWSERKPKANLAQLESDQVGELLAAEVAPNRVSLQISQLIEGLNIEFEAPKLVPLRQEGAQLLQTSTHQVLLLRANASVETVLEGLRSIAGDAVGPMESVDADLVGPQKRHYRRVPRSQLKARYVTACITQRWVQTVFTVVQGEKIRKRWERVDIPTYTHTWNDETYGQEVKTAPLKSGRKVFAAEGGFEHFSQNRTNIAVSKFWHSEVSDDSDTWNSAAYAEQAIVNKALLERGETEEVVDVGDFSPNKDVLIHDIRVSVRDMPLDSYRFFLGDNCIYVEESLKALEELGLQRSLPHAGEIHCTAISAWDAASYDRSIGIPDDAPLLLTNREQIRIPTCFSRHRPHSLDAEDFTDARVRIEIEYSDIDSGYSAHKFVRIPYLDQYPDADKLILPNRPWYQAWDRKDPLVVKGFATYFSPKAAIPQTIEGLAIYAVDGDGNEVVGKRLDLPNQTVGGGEESVSLTPAFVEGQITIEPGEYLSASGVLADGTPSADCAIFVLIEIPSDRVATTITNPLFKSNGVANLEYVQNGYNADRIISRPTPAGVGALEAVAECDLEPWATRLGLEELPEDEEQHLEILSDASTMLFID